MFRLVASSSSRSLSANVISTSTRRNLVPLIVRSSGACLHTQHGSRILSQVVHPASIGRVARNYCQSTTSKQHTVASSSHRFEPIPAPLPEPAKAPPKAMFSVRELALYSSILGLAAYFFHGLQHQERPIIPVEFVELPAPNEEFSHPYESESAFFKAFVRFKRFVYLTFLFVPCACVGVMVSFTQDQRWREYWLDLLVHTFESAGCGFQKFGQWMSMRPDMFPADIVQAMSRLRQNAPPHDYHHTRRMIRESFGVEIEELFEYFEETPVASGTVAQVHHARLRPEHAINGLVRDVAVKVQHPTVLDETFADIEFLFHILDNLKVMTMPFCKEQFLHSLRKQVNFEWEAHALSKFAMNFKEEMKRGEVCFPLVSGTLLSPSVLVESWVSGTTISDFFTEVGEGFKVVGKQFSTAVDTQKKQLAESIFSVCMKMFLRDNYMHGDLHAGNVIYDESRGILTVLDAGHTTSLGPDSASHFGQFMTGICYGDPERITTSLLVFHDRKSNLTPNVEGLKKDVSAACARWVGPDGRAPDGSPVCVGDLMGEIFFKLARNNVSLRGDVAISLVSIAVSEGLIRQLSPEFDINKKALPFIARFSSGAAV